MKKIKKKAEIKNCVICDSGEVKVVYPNEANLKKISFTYKFTQESRKTFQVLRCVNCSHVFCYPIPKNIYKYYKDVVDENYLEHSEPRKLSSKEIIRIIKKYKKNGRILDVGCATGDFLTVAKESGYFAEGLELSKWSSGIAEKKGLKIHRETLRGHSKKNPNKYDIISMWGVIEHFENPKAEMKLLNKLLKPGGLLILWTGDVDSFVSKILGRRWWYWQGQHIQYFTHSSLNLLTLSSGFKHIKTFLYPQAMSFSQLDNSLNRYKLKHLIMTFLRPLFFVKPIWYFRIPGEMFWIGKKKK